MTITVPTSAPREIGSYFVSCHVTDANGVDLAQCDSRLDGTWLDPEAPHELTLTIDDLWLRPGRYSVDVFLCSAGVMDAWEAAAIFEILPTLPYPETAGEDAYTHGTVLSDFRYEES